MKKVLAVLLVLVMVLGFAACGEKKPETKTANLQIGQYIGACHGTHCFSVVTAVVEGDKIVKAFIDEFQFMDHNAEGVVAVPNSDDATGLGGSYTGDNWLGSKRQSNTYYSNNMKNRAGATMEIAAGFDAIQAYYEGKTIAEIEGGADAVSGCTLADASNYVKGVAEAANLAQKNEAVAYEYTGDAYNFTLKEFITAAHGNRGFTYVMALTDGEKVVLSWLDEYQFQTAGAEGVVAVPNSEDFAANVVEGSVLGSKRQCTAAYSKNMAERGGATMTIDAGFDAVQAFANGKTFAELEGVDAITGCTLSSGPDYLAAILAAAKQ